RPRSAPVKTRTKDKYRVVYTDHQRLELEKEFHYSRYITIRRKAELAATLGLSERQVKIWFQNRRAKERKINKKKLQQQQQQQPQPPPPQPPQPQPGPLRSVPEPLSPVSSLQGSVPGPVPGVLGPAGGVLNPTVTQ
uniref:Homeobox domain-containing protein n=1 Tax=Spermophilus dauricus TaxID=99837 RepID=A0A8C9Q0L3_SPEDA